MYRLFTVLLAFILYSSNAQTLSGRMELPDGTPASFATIRLIGLPDSSFLTGSAADETGRYVIAVGKPGAYLVQASLIGYTDVFIPVEIKDQNDLEIPVSRLSGSTLSLGEATVRSKVPVVERLVDKTVINIEGTTAALGNSAYELLQRSPGVVITPQDAILLNGKSSVTVMFDGRPLQLSGSELINVLRSTPADNVRSIELISQPSSKYEAQGVGGIINIRLIKNAAAGWNGSVNGSYSQSLHHRAQGGINLNYRPGAVNLYLQYSLNDAAQLVDQRIERRVGNQVFYQTNPATSNWQTQFIKTGVDWNLDDRNSVGLLAIGSDYDHRTRAFNRTLILSDTQTESSLFTERFNPEQNRRWNVNLNYRYADTLGLEWTIDADRILFTQSSQNTLNNQRFDQQGNATDFDRLVTAINGDIGVWVLKSDWAKTTPSGYKAEAGFRTSWSTTDHDLFTTVDPGDGPTPDTSRSNLFRFDENIAAAYANYGRQSGPWRWQIGVRAERTRIDGRSLSLTGQTDNRPDTAYLGIFPTAYLQFQPADDHQLGLSLNRRLDRPAFQDLNPFIWQIDPYTSEQGNPYLRPSFSWNGEISYSYKDAAGLSIGYTRTTAGVSTIARQVGEQVFTQPDNLSRQDQISFNLNSPLPIKDWWEGYLWIGVWHNRFRAQLSDGLLDARAWGGGCYLSQEFTLPQSFRVEVSGWAQFPTRDGMFTNEGIWNANLAFKKNLLSDRLTLRLAWWDVFDSQRWVQKVDFGPVRGSMRNDWESQQLNIGLSWRFGRNSDNARDRNIGAEKENSRIKGGQ